LLKIYSNHFLLGSYRVDISGKILLINFNKEYNVWEGFLFEQNPPFGSGSSLSRYIFKDSVLIYLFNIMVKPYEIIAT